MPIGLKAKLGSLKASSFDFDIIINSIEVHTTNELPMPNWTLSWKCGKISSVTQLEVHEKSSNVYIASSNLPIKFRTHLYSKKNADLSVHEAKMLKLKLKACKGISLGQLMVDVAEWTKNCTGVSCYKLKFDADHNRVASILVTVEVDVQKQGNQDGSDNSLRLSGYASSDSLSLASLPLSDSIPSVTNSCENNTQMLKVSMDSLQQVHKEQTSQLNFMLTEQIKFVFATAEAQDIQLSKVRKSIVSSVQLLALASVGSSVLSFFLARSNKNWNWQCLIQLLYWSFVSLLAIIQSFRISSDVGLEKRGLKPPKFSLTASNIDTTRKRWSPTPKRPSTPVESSIDGPVNTIWDDSRRRHI